MSLQHFRDDDEGYLEWAENHPDGFTLNTQRKPGPTYLVLHRARCGTITTPTRSNYTTTDYAKTCSESRRELEQWAERELGGTVRPCRNCLG